MTPEDYDPVHDARFEYPAISFTNDDETAMKRAWAIYREYCLHETPERYRSDIAEQGGANPHTLFDTAFAYGVRWAKANRENEIRAAVEAERNDKTTASAVRFLAEWALGQTTPLPPLTVIAACDRALWWAGQRITDAEYEALK